jgi:hypothetical protein
MGPTHQTLPAPDAIDAGYLLVHVGTVVMVLLRREPTASSLAVLAAEVAQAHDAVGSPIVYLALIPRNARSISAEIRPMMGEFARFVSSVSSSVHLVIEADGFSGTILRSAITAVAMLTRERNLFIHGTLGEALHRISAGLPPDEGDAVELAARALHAAH